jgi:hypothetical protein
MFDKGLMAQLTAREQEKFRADACKFIRDFGLSNLRVQASSEILGAEEDEGACWYDAPALGDTDTYSVKVPEGHYDHIRKLDAWHMGYLMCLGIDEDGIRMGACTGYENGCDHPCCKGK